MSNNIYDILKKMQNLETPASNMLTESAKECKTCGMVKCKCDDKKHASKKKDKVKEGSIAEAVAQVEQQLAEKYQGFKKSVAEGVKPKGVIKPTDQGEEYTAAPGYRVKAEFEPGQTKPKIGFVKSEPEQTGQGAKPAKPAETPSDQPKVDEDLGDVAASIFYSPEGQAKRKAEIAASDRRFSDRSAKHFAGQIGDQYHDQLMKTMPSYADEYRERAKNTPYDKLGKLAQTLQAKHDPMGGPTNIDYEKIKKNPMATRAGEEGSDWRPWGPGPKNSFDSDEFGRPMREGEMDESGLQAYLGKKKYGKEGMQALQQAGREGASKEKMAKIRARHDKMDEGEYNEDMLSPKQKSFAALAEPKDKITYADKIAGAKKGKKTEGNKFSGNLMKARAKGLKRADLDGDGDMEPVREGEAYDAAWAKTQSERKAWEKSNPDKKYYDQGPIERHDMELRKARAADDAAKDAKRSPLGRVANTLSRGLFGQEIDEGRKSMREGWEEMQAYLEKKRGPESKGGAGKKAGTRYGGSAQRDDDEETDGEGQPAVKKKGRPKGTGGGAKFNFRKPKD